ncbi:UNVERIFIED_CONTAM: hypothetical protein O8I53_06470 [Campylobacter lari]
MVIGLSILIFLTSAVFTLLFTLRSTIVTGFQNYKNVSKLQDITVDLNLPTQGSTYNQGYYVNGETLDTLKEENKNDYSPIKYYVKDPTGEYANTVENILDLPKDEYIKLNEFKYILDNSPINTEYPDAYIKRSDIETLYAIYKADKHNDVVTFNLGSTKSDAEHASFELLKPKQIKLFSKNDDVFEPILKEINLPTSTVIHFDKEYLVGDLMQIKITKDTSVSPTKTDILAYQLSPLFINFNTKEATFDYSKGSN